MTIAVSAARMRDRLGKLLRADRRIIAAELVVVCAVYSLRLFPFGTQVYLLVFASLSLWLRGMSWRDLGLRRAEVWWKITLKALLAAFLIAVVVNLLVEPFVERLINSVANNARVESVRGNLRNLLLWLLAVWTIVAFGEEMIFRGYLMNRIADLVGRSRTGWILSLLGSTLIFGLAHEYQGLDGFIGATEVGLLLGILYLVNKRNIWVNIVCHGVFDSISLIAIYYSRPG